MACVTSLYVYLWLIILTLPLIISDPFVYGVEGPDEVVVHLQQKAEYHLRELVSTLNQLEASQSHGRHKRDLRGNKRTINISKSLKDICSQLSTTSHGSTTPASTSTISNPNTVLEENVKDKMEKNISFEGHDHPWKWPKQELSLISVEAQRDGNTSHFTFNIEHSSQAFIVKTHSLDFFRTTFGSDGKYPKPVVSQIQVSADTKECFDESINAVVSYTFGLIDDKDYIVEVDINLCEFDQIRTNVSDKSGILQTKRLEGVTVSQQIVPVDLRVFLPDQYYGNEMVIVPGKDSEFYFDVVLNRNKSSFDIWALFWDWEKEEFYESGAHLHFHDYPVEESMDILKIEIIHKSVLTSSKFNDEHRDAPSNSSVVVRAKVTISTGSRTMSGRLTLRYSWFDPEPANSEVSQMVGVEKDVYLKLPYKMTALPSKVIVNGGGQKVCRNDGHRYSKPECIFDCFGTGSNIKSIFIVKNDPYVPPVKSMSYVLNGKSAVTMVDMGPPSPELNGTFQCVVVTDDGKVQSVPGTLLSFGLALIHSTTVKDFKNGSVQLSCVASGVKPISISLGLADRYYNYEVLNLEHEVVTLKTVENKTTLEIRIPTTRLLFPITSVECNAFGAFASDSKTVAVSAYIEEYNVTAPIVKPDLFTMKHFKNGTSRISCTASGGKNVKVDIHSPDYQYGNHDYSLTEYDTKDGKTIVLYLPTRIVSRLMYETYVSCMARNSRGLTQIGIKQENIDEF